MPHPEVQGFISRWSGATASERANIQLFLCELCDILGVPTPARKRPWPSTLAVRVKSVADALEQRSEAVTPAEMASLFARARPEDVQEILEPWSQWASFTAAKRKGRICRD